jgi:high-affinity iron transporter
LAVVLAFTAEFVYARAAAAPPGARMLAAQGSEVRIPITELTDSSLHFYATEVNNTALRFLVIHKSNGDYTTALDACQICGAQGYRQEGSNVICRNCAAAIYVPSIGDAGGCNPIPVKSKVVNGELIVDLSALADSAALIHK